MYWESHLKHRRSQICLLPASGCTADSFCRDISVDRLADIEGGKSY